MDGGLSDFLRIRFVRKEVASDDSSSQTIVYFLVFLLWIHKELDLHHNSLKRKLVFQ